MLENIGDPATDPQAKRSITIVIEIVPSKDRAMAEGGPRPRPRWQESRRMREGAIFMDLTSHGIVASTREPEPELENLDFPKKGVVSND